MAKVKVTLNKDLCIGCGSCFASHPELFELEADGKANVVAAYRDVEITDPAMIEKAKNAQSLCPNQAIQVEELPE